MVTESTETAQGSESWLLGGTPPSYTPIGGGRPNKYTPELATEILDRLEAGETLRHICNFSHMPNRRTVEAWSLGMAAPKEFGAMMDAAKKIGHSQRSDGTVEVARGLGDSSGDVARDRLIIDTDQKYLRTHGGELYKDSTTIRGDSKAPLTLTIASRLDAATKRIEGLVIDGDVTGSEVTDID